MAALKKRHGKTWFSCITFILSAQIIIPKAPSLQLCDESIGDSDRTWSFEAEM